MKGVYSSPGSSFLVIYGRRRVGKTALVKEFLRNKLGIYFFVGEKDEALLLEEYSRKIEDKLSAYLPGYIKAHLIPSKSSLSFFLSSHARKSSLLFLTNFRTLKPSSHTSLPPSRSSGMKRKRTQTFCS
ncbi:hypothetical protein [Thermococcus sp.]|uniref:hypothetical protein n=1 Tax=Thermococcus sp. TaxID=35749 RepID=UPI002622B331|nr:hypothetical protein [Thermococcus sp.]